MKRLITILQNQYRVSCITLILICFLSPTSAQICSDPTNVVYGLTLTGVHAVTLSTGNVAPKLNPNYTGNPASNSNGIGYSPLNGKFYFFKRSPGSAPQEFVSFDPLTNTFTALSSCPTTYSVYIGCVTANGLGYYCWDSNARLFYYNVGSNTWTLITTTIVDQFGNDVDAVLRAHGSGDVTADGLGRLLMVPSSASRYALYRMNSPLPTTAVASITVTQLVPLTLPPAKFVGIALTPAGQMILNTAVPNNRLYRLENNLSLTPLANLSQELADLTSCNFPLSVLPLSIKDFSTTSKNNSVFLKWNITESTSDIEYLIEHSLNGVDWGKVGHIKDNNAEPFKTISFTHNNPRDGKNYYRIRLLAASSEVRYSEVKTVVVEKNASVGVWPNPVQNVLWVRNNSVSKASIFDEAGRKIKATDLLPGTNNINIEKLATGRYIVMIQTPNGDQSQTYKIIKE